VRYEITFGHPLSERARAAFPELAPSTAEDRTRTLVGEVTDRTELDGLLTRAGDLGLQVVGLRRIPG